MLISLLTSLALAVPTSLTHQGRLLDGDGRPVEGDHTLSFSLYDASIGGGLVWSETHVTPFSGGLYTVELGSTTPLDEGVFDGGRLFLELSVDGGPAMSPRHALTSVPYAQRAAVAGSVAYEDITGVPEDLLTNISCLDGEVLVYDAMLASWSCGTDADTQLSESEVVSIVGAEGYALLIDLAPVGLTGSYTDLTDVPADLADGDDDTLAWLGCGASEIPVFDGLVWGCGALPSDDVTATEVRELSERVDALEAMLEDSDGDGVLNSIDNCQDVPNVGQLDLDLDGIGDVCDICPVGFNDLDGDGDGVPDACDPFLVVDEAEADGSGWSNTRVTTASVDGDLVGVHGMWGSDVPTASQSWTLGAFEHTEVEVSFRYYAIDTWDGELASLWVDDEEVWAETKVHTTEGTGDGWVTVSEFTPNFHSASHSIEGYWDKILVVPHTADTLTLTFSSMIDQEGEDESWGFSHVQVIAR